MPADARPCFGSNADATITQRGSFLLEMTCQAFAQKHPRQFRVISTLLSNYEWRGALFYALTGSFQPQKQGLSVIGDVLLIQLYFGKCDRVTTAQHPGPGIKWNVRDPE
jgi:hypothetical protein